ncbi:phosphoadenosine phosphosulfate reductase family protein, partial [Arthrospira platensis SPKY2]
PGILVILIDTGYLFPETYRFIDELTARLGLNLKVYRSALSPAWQEARHGPRWLEGEAGLDAYHRENKIEPMQRALTELGASTWFAGLRREQSASRRDVPLVLRNGDFWKVHPIGDWT